MGVKVPAVLLLLSLSIHYAVLTVTMHYSRLHGVGPLYKSSSAIVLAEVVKLLLCVGIVVFSGEAEQRVADWKQDVREVNEYHLVDSHENEKQVEDIDIKIIEPMASSRGGPRHRTSIDMDSYTSSSPTSSSGPGQSSLMAPNARSSLSKKGGASLSIRVPSPTSGVPSLALVPPTPMSSVIPQTPIPPPTPRGTTLHPHVGPALGGPLDRDPGDYDALDRWGEKLEWLSIAWEVFVVEGSGGTAIPAALFLFQSNAQYLASENLTPAAFTILYQLKIPATALCSWLLLRRKLSARQWASVVVLMAGVTLVQLASSTKGSTAKSRHAEEKLNTLVGCSAVVAASLSSGFASVFLEGLLKSRFSSTRRPASLWARNIQLSIWGLAFGLPVAWYDSVLSPQTINKWTDISATGWERFWEGFGVAAWSVVALQATGGLLAALIMQKLDNVAKCFATAISILLSSLASVFLFGFTITLPVWIGAILVVAAAVSYAM